MVPHMGVILCHCHCNVDMYLTAKQLFQVAQVPLSVVLSCVNILPLAVFCISFTGCANSHLICWKNSLHKWTCELYVQQSVQVLREGTTTISFCTEIALGCTTWIVLVVCSVSYAIPPEIHHSRSWRRRTQTWRLPQGATRSLHS